jgi:hypothetical protein
MADVNKPRYIEHPLEDLLQAPASDILEAVHHGFRAQVDVKGKLAELYLARQLEMLQNQGKISGFTWNDKDDEPDFVVRYQGKALRFECKNVRSGKDQVYEQGEHEGWYRVEIQKTRGGTDPRTGKQTRGYRFDRFEILAACLFNQTNKWDYLFTTSRNLARRHDNPDLLAVFQPVPPTPISGWTRDLREVCSVGPQIQNSCASL